MIKSNLKKNLIPGLFNCIYIYILLNFASVILVSEFIFICLHVSLVLPLESEVNNWIYNINFYPFVDDVQAWGINTMQVYELDNIKFIIKVTKIESDNMKDIITKQTTDNMKVTKNASSQNKLQGLEIT